ncbi:MAG: SCP2 sterol-binding domain-containing protein [Halanaerobiales bacterium]|nr:SCP2 sterol-binding domain-containing protein [Halanaerobiales bacterium]
MSFFKNWEEFWKLIVHLEELLLDDEEAVKSVKRIKYLKVGTDLPDLEFGFTTTIENGQISITKNIDEDTHVVLRMNSDVYHNINIGKLNAMKALIKDEIVFAKGGMKNILQANNLPTQKFYKIAAKNLGY